MPRNYGDAEPLLDAPDVTASACWRDADHDACQKAEEAERAALARGCSPAIAMAQAAAVYAAHMEKEGFDA